MVETAAILEGLSLQSVELVVEDLASTVDWLTEGYGFTAAKPVQGAQRSIVEASCGQARLTVCTPLTDEDRGAVYLERHGDGVSDIGFGVSDVVAAFTEVVRRGASPIAEPAIRDGVFCATVGGFGDVTHTLVETVGAVAGGSGPVATESDPATLAQPAPAPGELTGIDHFAVVLEAGQLEPTVAFYERVFDFEMMFTEHIVVGAQGMNSKVVRSGSGSVTFTLIEPDVTRPPGQIDEFLARHGGPGIQHIAYSTTDIVRAIERSSAAGQEFLTTPGTYYELLGERLIPIGHGIEELARLSILVDEDHYGQLFQIFSRSIHPRNTLFFEVIERLGARTFGSNNIKALYEAVELQRMQQDRQSVTATLDPHNR